VKCSFLARPRPVVAGHRGDPRRYPDNTLTGIISGLAAGGAVEVDVRLAADGHLVLSHDPDIGGYAVAETPWPLLAELEIGDGYRPCLLDEAMALPGCFDLEVKNLPTETGFDPAGRLALSVASRARPRDIVTSFYWPDLDRIRSHAAHVRTGLLVGQDGPVEDAILHAAEAGHTAVVVHDDLIDGVLISAVAAANVALVAWTVNDLDRARELSQLGVAAIISDRPHILSSALREHHV
jgi:glycerophosphoryl diester phosphodiesterase